MTTRIALPFTLGFKMSGTRRHGPPDPLPQTSQVRKNLFGPIDHEENLKFVQDELNKISQADCKRWNFDFQAEKPKEGRYNWEPVSGKVPQAYEMRAMACTRSQPPPQPATTATSQPTAVPQPTTATQSAIPQEAPQSTTAALPSATVPEHQPTTATTASTALRKRKAQDRGGGTMKKQKTTTATTTTTTTTTTAAATASTTSATTSTADKRPIKSSQQPSITGYMSIRRRVPSLPKPPKEAPPSLLKKSQPSPPSSS